MRLGRQTDEYARLDFFRISKFFVYYIKRTVLGEQNGVHARERSLSTFNRVNFILFSTGDFFVTIGLDFGLQKL